MGNEYNLISSDAQTALTEFSEEFTAALMQSGVEPWAKTLGLYRTSSALKTTYPIPVSAAGYSELKGDLKYRAIFQKSISLVPKTWQDGVAELASVIEAPDFVGWTDQPAAMAAAAESLPNDIIADLLAANAVQDFDGKAFFANDHPYNVFDSGAGSFDNDVTGAGTDSTVNNLSIAMQYFRDIKGPNGKPAGFRMTHVLVPASLEGVWKNILEQDMIVQAVGTAFGAVSNRFKGTIKLVVSDELTNDLQWYPLALSKPGAFPWLVQDQGAPEEIIQDKTDALYKTTLKVGIAYVLRGGGGLALPHTMQRWAGTAP